MKKHWVPIVLFVVAAAVAGVWYFRASGPRRWSDPGGVIGMLAPSGATPKAAETQVATASPSVSASQSAPASDTAPASAAPALPAPDLPSTELAARPTLGSRSPLQVAAAHSESGSGPLGASPGHAVPASAEPAFGDRAPASIAEMQQSERRAAQQAEEAREEYSVRGSATAARMPSARPAQRASAGAAAIRRPDADLAPLPAIAPPPAAQDASAPAGKTIKLGQTVDQVVAVLGQPRRIAKLGSKQIYVYSDWKVTFVDGKVTTVE